MNLREDIAERFSLPAEAAGLVKLTLTGRRLLIENHRGLLEYDRERIEVAGGSTRIVVTGEELCLSAMDRKAILICGTLVSVELI